MPPNVLTHHVQVGTEEGNGVDQDLGYANVEQHRNGNGTHQLGDLEEAAERSGNAPRRVSGSATDQGPANTVADSSRFTTDVAVGPGELPQGRAGEDPALVGR